MTLLLSAPAGGPRFVGEQLLAAARRLGHDAFLFDHPASRDPTLELPEAARTVGADRVLLVEVDREDPVTIDVLRELGAHVAVWLAPAPDAAPSWWRARRRWIAGAADRLFVTDPSAAPGACDRHGRPGEVLARGFDARTLSPEGAGEGTPPEERPALRTALRDANDPLTVRLGERPFRGLGAKAAFPPGTRVEPLERADRFAERVRGTVYVAGGRASRSGAPGVFDDVAAARALGASIERWDPYAAAPFAHEAPAAAGGDASFEARLRTILREPGDEA